MSNEQGKEPTGDETEGRTVPLNELEPDDIQPVDDAEGWEVDDSHNFVGTPVAVEHDDGTVDEGRIAAIWTFRGQAGPRRRGPSRPRGPVQRGDRKCRVPITCLTRGGRDVPESGLVFIRDPPEDNSSTRQASTHPRLRGASNEGDLGHLSLPRAGTRVLPPEWHHCLSPWRPARSSPSAASMPSSSPTSGRPAVRSRVARQGWSA